MVNAIVKEAAEPAELPVSLEGVITDGKGRKLTIRELDFVDEADIISRLTAEQAANTTYLSSYLLPSLMIVEIDGQPLDLPSTEKEIRHHLKLVGREGMNALLEHLGRVAQARIDQKAAVKN